MCYCLLQAVIAWAGFRFQLGMAGTLAVLGVCLVYILSSIPNTCEERCSDKHLAIEKKFVACCATFELQSPYTVLVTNHTVQGDFLMKQNLTELVFLFWTAAVPCRGWRGDTIGGFNSMLEKQKKNPDRRLSPPSCLTTALQCSTTA